MTITLLKMDRLRFIGQAYKIKHKYTGSTMLLNNSSQSKTRIKVIQKITQRRYVPLHTKEAMIWSVNYLQFIDNFEGQIKRSVQ